MSDDCGNCQKTFCVARSLRQLSAEQLLEYKKLLETIEEKVNEVKIRYG
jgi:hypothetical protein